MNLITSKEGDNGKVLMFSAKCLDREIFLFCSVGYFKKVALWNVCFDEDVFNIEKLIVKKN